MVVNKKKLVMVFLLIYGIGVFLYFYITGRKYQKIYSQYLEEKRLFRVHLPEGYGESQERYPVFYLLDANNSIYFSRAAETIDKLGGNHVPKMILVGILNTNRNRDMLPTESRYMISSGGADKFLKFITRELISFIDKKYRTRDFRILYGGSDAGLFTVYSLLAEPGSFSAWIAVSPCLGHCPALINGMADQLFSTRKLLNKILYIIYGEHDYPLVTTAVPSFVNQLREANPEGFRWEARIIKGEGHIPVSSQYNGLKFIFSGWESPRR
jgi:predicted alpha/beta superfamily hydrolase